MPQEEHFDAIVIGAGKAGTPLASTLADRGMRTAFLDGRFIGTDRVGERAITKSLGVSAQ